ncbi:AT hook domain-containing protein [Colletotrichum graminicola]|uniref:AT hook domain-containing protein n=1 Tax=Colletotrichum graminicola (strain M1.001 / M2 / FGSC 10212) TaxID=645133 RepID=E3QWF5_COLGM|nr:AT hook domain-containing protein [Colletotrichum graminicola M1.001]EFQ35193.1 AT hook domain-containing protein [Colletotrichum graminicola M1.001]WDK10006.1 AT hook domain-containing protein [Colletotrichum graminicola]
MALARVIADSDDSDDDFELGDSPLKPPTPKVPSGSRSSDPASIATGSTDPKFFQEVYTEQQRAAAIETTTIPGQSLAFNEPNIISPHVKVQVKQDTTTASSPISIAEPIKDHIRAKGKAKVADLAQVTTPGRRISTMPKDMWDVPSSPAGNQAAPVFVSATVRTPRSNTKRKRETTIDLTSPLAIGMPSQGSTQPFDITPATRRNAGSVHEIKRSRHENLGPSGPAEDDIDMVVVPDDVGVPSFTDLVSGQKPVSLCIEPQTLSASQRLEYQYHSVNPSPEDQGPVPTQPFSTLPATARSSGATTIAYSTPSQTRVVGLPLVPLADHTTLDTVPEQTQQASFPTQHLEAIVELQSSPDIISAAPARRKRDRSDCSLPKTAEAHEGREKWETDGIAFLDETYRPRLSQRRGSDACWQDQAENLEETDMPVADMGPAAQLPTEEPAPASTAKTKKRGRPKKSHAAAVVPTVTAVVPVSPQASESCDVAKDLIGADVAVDVAAGTPQTKKRGRPRKTNKATAVSTQQEAEAQPIVEAANPSDSSQAETAMDEKHTKEMQPCERAKSIRGRRGDKKQDPVDSVVETSTGDGPQARDGSLVLQPVASNAALKLCSEGLGPEIAAPELKAMADKTVSVNEQVKAEAVGKADKKKTPTMPASSTGKPIYRVGLSRKSRIAPLLKSLRK